MGYRSCLSIPKALQDNPHLMIACQLRRSARSDPVQTLEFDL